MECNNSSNYLSPSIRVASDGTHLYEYTVLAIRAPHFRSVLRLEIGEMVISAYIGLIGLLPARLDRLLSSFNPIYYMPHMTSYSNKVTTANT